ncbi:MAG TPA: methyltransferase [Candidatus Sulfotelmatobacter sp.]|nr:methyltransferase [Candidatus Sulfotelmatobacter sp.]
MSSFDERARTWDTPDRRARAIAVAQAVREHVPLTRSTRTIEIGAGTGLLGLALADEVGELVLAEPSAGMLEVAREKLGPPAAARISAVPFDLLTDPPPGGPFDLAISLLVLHHLPDTHAALAAILRLLRPGGRIAIADLEAEDGTFHEPGSEGIYHEGFERGHLAGLARAAGFADVAVVTATEIERNGRVYPVILLLGRRP